MHAVSSRWRKPSSRMSKRKLAAIKRGKARLSAEKNDALLPANPTAIDSGCILSDETNVPSTSNENLQQNLLPRDSNFEAPASYAFINTNVLCNILQNVKCSECLCGTLFVNSANSFGFSTMFEVICKECGHMFATTFSSPRVPEKKQSEIDKRIVEAFLKIGKGHAALEVFSLVLGINTLDKKTFSKCLNNFFR